MQKTIDVNNTLLSKTAEVARSIGIFVDADAIINDDASISIGANECGDIDTEAFWFYFTLNPAETLVTITGTGIEHETYAQYDQTDSIKTILIQALRNEGFFQTWVKIVSA